MRTTRLLICAAGLSLVNLASVVLGFWLYKMVGGANQLAIQLPVALSTGILGGALWLGLCGRFARIDPVRDHVVVLLLAFPVAAAVFTPVHYAVTGYLTSFGNIVAVWFIQFAENIVAIPVASALARRRALREGAV